MVNCISCFWANFDNETQIRHVITEPDIFAKVKPGQPVPSVEVVKSCGEGCHYFKSYGPTAEHTCDKWSDAEKVEEANRDQYEQMADGFELETTRVRLPSTDNMLVLMEKMSEGVDEVFLILLDVFSLPDPVAITHLIHNLNDMNVRGPQIVEAFKFAGSDHKALCDLAHDRDDDLINHVNKSCDNVNTGPAIKRFAASFGHVEEPDEKPTNAKPRKARTRLRKRLRTRSRRNKKNSAGKV